jgi:hypothetical protein
VVESSIVVKYSLYRVLLHILTHFVNPIDFCWKSHRLLLAGNVKGGCSRLAVVFLLGSSPTVEMENRVKRLQPNVNSPLFRFRPSSNDSIRYSSPLSYEPES